MRNVPSRCRINIAYLAVITATIIILCSTLLIIFDISGARGNKGCELVISNQETRLCNYPNEVTRYQIGYNGKLRRLPQAIIIGSRKGGTRALLKFLQLNPNVRAATNEVHYFDRPHNYELGIDWYRMQMPESEVNEITMEKSPAYFVTQGVPERIKSMNSSIKLILILRDPVTRLISDYSQLIANKMKVIETDTYEDEELTDYGSSYEYRGLNANDTSNSSKFTWQKAAVEFPKFILRPDGGVDDRRRAIRIGMYSVHLERWLSVFHMSQFHFVNGENLIKDPQSELNKIELFLGLRPLIRREDFTFNEKKGFFCLSRANSSNSKVEFDRNAKTNNTVNGASDHQASCLSRSKGRKHVNVSWELKEKLQKFYAPYNEYLYSLTNINFNWSSIN